MNLLNKFIVVPISWDPNSLVKMYANISKNVDSLLEKPLNDSLRKGLIGIKGVIKLKTVENMGFVKNFITSGLLNNITLHSVVRGESRKKRQLGIAAFISNLVVSGFEEIQIQKLEKLYLN